MDADQTMSTKERHFICPECGSKELALVRTETVSRGIYQVTNGSKLLWEYGKEAVFDCTLSETQCGNGHPLTLKNGMVVQDDLEALEQWFEERAES